MARAPGATTNNWHTEAYAAVGQSPKQIADETTRAQQYQLITGQPSLVGSI